jgi:hypothetical protein
MSEKETTIRRIQAAIPYQLGFDMPEGYTPPTEKRQRERIGQASSKFYYYPYPNPRFDGGEVKKLPQQDMQGSKSQH